MIQRKVIECNEQTSFPITATLKNGAGTVVTLAATVSIEITLVNVLNTTFATSIVNGRQKQNALNTGDFTLHSTSGLFTWKVQPEDTTILGTVPIGKRESHLATLTALLTNGEQIQQEIELSILNLRNVPQVAP